MIFYLKTWSDILKKRTKAILGFLLILLVILNLTIPSDDDYYEWLEDEYSIQESEELYHYNLDGTQIFDLSTNKTLYGIFAVRQQNFKYVDNGKVKTDGFSSTAFKEVDPDEGLTIRTLEIGSKIFPMKKDNVLWEILS